CGSAVVKSGGFKWYSNPYEIRPLDKERMKEYEKRLKDNRTNNPHPQDAAQLDRHVRVLAEQIKSSAMPDWVPMHHDFAQAQRIWSEVLKPPYAETWTGQKTYRQMLIDQIASDDFKKNFDIEMKKIISEGAENRCINAIQNVMAAKSDNPRSKA